MTKRYWFVILTYLFAQFSVIGFAPLLVILFQVDLIEASIYGSISGFVIGLILTIFILRDEFKKEFLNRIRNVELIVEIIVWSILGLVIAYAAQTIAILVELNILGIDPASENTAELMEITRRVPVFIIITALIAPIFEEIIFRKILFGVLYKRMNFFIAGVLSSLIFGVIHQDLDHILIYTTMGFVFAFLYIRSKSIIVPIIVHMTMNSITVFAQLYLPPEKLEELSLQWETLQSILSG